MQSSTQALSLILPLVLVGLVVTASIAFHRVRSLALPISTATSTATVILPILTGVTLRGTQSLIRGSHGGRSDTKLDVSRSAMIMVMLLFIYDTIIATLALTYMVPPSDLKCHLEGRWTWLFSNKNAEVIRRIQDRHQCCGFNSVQDRAWPFPDRSHTAVACHEAFGRERSCFGGWRQDEQITGGLMLLVAVVAILIKVLVLVIYQTRNPFQSFTQSASAASGEERAGSNRRREIEYHDEPSRETRGHVADSQTRGEGHDQRTHAGPAMQPSRLHDEGSEWREV